MSPQTIHKYLTQLFDFTSGDGLVLKIIGLVFGGVFSFLVPIQHFLIGIFVFVMFDLFTGWRKSVRILRDQNISRSGFKTITSRGIGKTLEKLTIYLVLMIACRTCDWIYMLSSTFSLSWYVGGLIIVREIKSIFENADNVLDSKFFVQIRSTLSKITNKHK